MRSSFKIVYITALAVVIFLFSAIFLACKVTGPESIIIENPDGGDITAEPSRENAETTTGEVDTENINDIKDEQFEIMDISPERVNEIILGSEIYFILDVRTQEEYDQGHLEDAYLIPVQELADRLGEVPFNLPVIVYCRSGARSRNAAEILLKNGYQQIYDMGGIMDWQDQGYPIVVEGAEEYIDDTEEGEEVKKYIDITVDEAFEFYNNEDYLFLDVRTQEEYDSGHIKGALHIPVYELADRLDEVPKDKSIIAYCNGSSCGRSDTAADILTGSGFTNIYDIGGGGIDEWTGKGYPVENN